MGQKVTFGGKRLGSGGGIEIYMDGYHASNHDLGFVFRSTTDAGTLIPFCKIPMVIGDNFDIDTQAIIKTLPSGGPSFGKFKYQIDWFFCPNRLYIGGLHNNATGIGRKMGQVLIPTIKFPVFRDVFKSTMDDPNQTQVASDSLVAYLGIRGFGENISNDVQYREFNGIPFLAYPDIFKNFYANKQEKQAYIISGTENGQPIENNCAWVNAPATGRYNIPLNAPNHTNLALQDWNVDALNFNQNTLIGFSARIVNADQSAFDEVIVQQKIGETKSYNLPNLSNNAGNKTINLQVIQSNDQGYKIGQYAVSFKLTGIGVQNINYTISLGRATAITTPTKTNGIRILPFALENIDNARDIILSQNKIGQKVTIGENENINFSPYVDVTIENTDENGKSTNNCITPKCGLLLRTYMGDVFNNWVQTDWIDEINVASTIHTDANGSFTMDALVVAKRVWEYQNRIAVSGGTYQDWQEATWGRNAQSFCESPIYMGGASGTIGFEEIVSTGAKEDLGELGGRGTSFNHKGGKVNVKAQEIGYLIGIFSIVPYIDYYQGNDWDMTELVNMESYHMPQFDGIGFQDLITERMAAWDTKIGANGKLIKKSAGKQPAWSQYMTNHNKVYGDFCRKNNAQQMVITREYKGKETENGLEIADLTTYVFPDDYNYLFVADQLEFNPFWVQIGCDIFARRLMSAAVMPQL